MASQDSPDPFYSVIIRVPFTRGDFVDPAPVSLRSRLHSTDQLIALGVLGCSKRSVAMEGPPEDAKEQRDGLE